MLRLLRSKPFRKWKFVQRLLDKKRAQKLRNESEGNLGEEPACATATHEAAEERCDCSHNSSTSVCCCQTGNSAEDARRTSDGLLESSGTIRVSVSLASVPGCEPASVLGLVATQADIVGGNTDNSDICQSSHADVPFHVRVRCGVNVVPLSPYNEVENVDGAATLGLDRRGALAIEGSAKNPTEASASNRRSRREKLASHDQPPLATAGPLHPGETGFVRTGRRRHSMPEAGLRGMSRLHRLRRSITHAAASRKYTELVDRPSASSLAALEDGQGSDQGKGDEAPRLTAHEVSKVIRRSFRKSGKYLKYGIQSLSAVGLASGLGWAMGPSYAVPSLFTVSTTV